MKHKLPFLGLCAVLCAGTGFAQTRTGYVFDNFDTRNGVQIAVPPLPALPPLKTKKGKNAPATAKAAPRVKPTALVTPVLPALPNTPAGTRYEHPYGLQMAAGNSLDGYTTGDPVIDGYIVKASRRNGLDPLLVYSLMHQESSFKRRALSYKGASGLMQLMPATAARFGVRDIFDPEMNIEGGTRYLRFLLDMFEGDVPLALAGYNAGEGAVLKYKRRVPPYNETQEYVRRISSRYMLLRNPETARVARRLTTKEAVQVVQKESAPLTIYERTVFVVRSPDGKLQLLNQ